MASPVALAPEPVALDRLNERPAPPRARVELLGAALGLALLAIVMCSTHIARGGFYFDDWSTLELARFPPPGGLLHGLWLDYGQRPVQVLYYAALSEAFGTSASPRLALAAATAALEASCLYGLLRHLNLDGLHAFAIAALTLLFPFSDSVWLWGIVSLASLSVAAALLGVILALRALRSRGPRALALHGASLSLYLVSILSYEVIAVAGCLAGLLYVRAVGWPRARVRWALDVLLIVTSLLVARAVLPIDVATPSRLQSLGGMVAHAGLLAGDGVRLAGAALLPVSGVSPWIGAALLASVLAMAATLRRLPSTSKEMRFELGRWLAGAGAGALLALAAWAVYLPAPNHYSPIASGTVNRMNVLAAIGIVTLLYSCLVLTATMLAALLQSFAPTHSSRALASLCITASAFALAFAYLERTSLDARAWDRAAAEQRALLAELHATLSHPSPTATVYALGVPQMVGLNIPVLDTTLDLTSAMRISYSSPTLTGAALTGSTSIVCGPRGPFADGVRGSYGNAYLVDLHTRRATRLMGRAQCARAVDTA